MKTAPAIFCFLRGRRSSSSQERGLDSLQVGFLVNFCGQHLAEAVAKVNPLITIFIPYFS